VFVLAVCAHFRFTPVWCIPVADDTFGCLCSCRKCVFPFCTAYFLIADDPFCVCSLAGRARFRFTWRTYSSLTIPLCPCSCRAYVFPFHRAHSLVTDAPVMYSCSCSMCVSPFHETLATPSLTMRLCSCSMYVACFTRVSYIFSSLTMNPCVRALTAR
jgi:hypothetical protein